MEAIALALGPRVPYPIYTGWEGGDHRARPALSNVSPPGVALKPVDLDLLSGPGIVPVRSTRMWRAVEGMLGGSTWPPAHLRNGLPCDMFHLRYVDWALGLGPENSGTSRSGDLVIDGITSASSDANIALVERFVDEGAAARLFPTELARARREISSRGFPTYGDTGIVSVLSRTRRCLDS